MQPKKPTIILAASMPRSGSTWLYNVARVLLTSTEQLKANFSCGWIGDIDNIPTRALMLIKLHDFNQALVNESSFVFYSYRDVRDALASMKRKFGLEPSLDAASNFILHHNHWINQSHFVMKYEDMAENKASIVANLATRFQLNDVDVDAVLAEVEPMKSAPVDKYDTENLYHAGHITDGRHGSWEGIISPELEKEILDKHRDWFEQYGYI